MSAAGLFVVADQVLVTGASSGLGAHIARTLAAHGARGAIAARRRDRLAALAETMPGRLHPVTIDVTSSASVDAGFAEAHVALGGLDVLVNCPGVARGSSLHIAEVDWNAVFDTNVRGAWLMSRAFGHTQIAAARAGTIVNIASILGLRMAGGGSAYAASKAALIQLTKAMALELARHAIRVSVLCPVTSRPILTAISSLRKRANGC